MLPCPYNFGKLIQGGLVLMCHQRETFHPVLEGSYRLLQIADTIIRDTGNLTDALKPQSTHWRHLCPCRVDILSLHVKMAKLPFDGAAGSHRPDVRVQMTVHQIHHQKGMWHHPFWKPSVLGRSLALYILINAAVIFIVLCSAEYVSHKLAFR